MENLYTDRDTPTKISEKRIYNIYCNHYDSIHYLFIEFQFSWLQQAYKARTSLKSVNKLTKPDKLKKLEQVYKA